MFSGGSYDDVARWLRMFLTSHAKREHPRVEVVLDEDDTLHGRAYRARLRLGPRASEPLELAEHHCHVLGGDVADECPEAEVRRLEADEAASRPDKDLSAHGAIVAQPPLFATPARRDRGENAEQPERQVAASRAARHGGAEALVDGAE